MKIYKGDLNKNKLNDFIFYLEYEKNYSTNTIEKYKHNLEELILYLDEKKILITNIEQNDLNNFIYVLFEKKLDSNSISNYISSIKSFFKYLYKKEIINNNFSENLIYPKKKKKLPMIMYTNEIKQFFQTIDKFKKYNLRNKSLFLILYTTGIRVSECSELKIINIDFYQKTIKILGKGNKERVVPVHEYTLKILERYLDCEREKFVDSKSNKYVFINNRGQKITSRGIRYLTTKIANECSEVLKISPHTFRHTLATELLKNGLDLRLIQEILGHKNLTSTEVYTSLNDNEIKKKYQKAIRRI